MVRLKSVDRVSFNPFIHICGSSSFQEEVLYDDDSGRLALVIFVDICTHIHSYIHMRIKIHTHVYDWCAYVRACERWGKNVEQGTNT